LPRLGYFALVFVFLIVVLIIDIVVVFIEVVVVLIEYEGHGSPLYEAGSAVFGFGSVGVGYVDQKWRPHFGHTQN
jgi:hypothetical protein